MVAIAPYRPYGGAAELFSCSDREVLFEGPAGTGKTRGVCEYVNYLCATVKNMRVLFLRKTLKALRTTVLPIWEDEVLGRGHPAMHGNATRRTRDDYIYPDTGAWVLLGGLDDVDKYMSGAFDLIIIFEGTDNRDETVYARLMTRLRNYALWYQQIINDVNPKEKHHYLNQRAGRCDEDGQSLMRRILSRHRDNPKYFDHERGVWTRQGLEYVEGTLKNTPVRSEYERLYLGNWVSATGRIFETHDPARCDIRGYLDWDDTANAPRWGADGCLTLVLDASSRAQMGQESVSIRWCIGGQDWGHREPGCFQAWGMDADRRAFRLSEVYRDGETLDWWADNTLPLVQAFRLRRVMSDHADGGSGAIKMMNDRMGPYQGRDGRRVFTEANKDWKSGIDLVQWGFGTHEDHTSNRIFFVQPSLEHLDHPSSQLLGSVVGPTENLVNRGCVSTENELSGYVWRDPREGKQLDEEPDPQCPDHGIDAMRYALMGAWRVDEHKPAPPPQYDPDALYYKLGHDELDKEIARDEKRKLSAQRRAKARARRRKKKGND